MSKHISSSPYRHQFQKEKYMSRCAKNNQEPNIDYLNMLEDAIVNHGKRWEDPASRENSLEYDLLTTEWILEKARQSIVYSQNLYAAMCNNEFLKNQTWPILKNQMWSCSWRYAGGIIADMREEGDYIDWYCSGIKNTPSDEELADMPEESRKLHTEVYCNYVGEGMVTDEIESDLLKLGWLVIKDSDI